MKVTVGGAALIAVAVAGFAGTGAYFFLRHLEKQQAGEAESVTAINMVKARFGSRPPLVEVGDPHRVDFRINRPEEASSSKVTTIHVINWKSETSELVRADVPLWLMRFSSLNILSQLGVAPEKVRLTVQDVERYGPGIIIDYGTPGAFRLLVWVE